MATLDYSTKNSITLNIKSPDEFVKPLKVTITKKTPQIFYQIHKRIEGCNSSTVIVEILIQQMCSRTVEEIIQLQDKHFPGLFCKVGTYCVDAFKGWYADKMNQDISDDQITFEEE